MRHLLFLLFFISFYVGKAQEYFANTRKIGMEGGLTHYKVNVFYPEEDGMWIGTADGLNFYDGFNWRKWKKETGHFKYKSVDFIQKDQSNQLWLFYTNEIIERNAVKAIYILNPENEKISSFEEKLGPSSPFQISTIQNFFEDHQHRLYFFADNQLWRYSSGTLFESIKLPKGFKPHSVFSDGSYIGHLDDKVVLVSAAGEVIFTSNYSLRGNSFQVIGDRQNYIVWEEGSTCMQYKLQPDNQYSTSSFPLQREGNLNFNLVQFDKQRNQFWLYSEPYLYLTDSNGNVLYRDETFPRTACIDTKSNLWLAKFGITVLQTQKKNFNRYLYKEEYVKNKEEYFRCRGIVEKNGNLFITTYNGLRVIDLKTNKIQPFPQNIDLGFVILKGRDHHLWGAKRDVNYLKKNDKGILNTFSNKSYQSRIWSMYEDIEGRIWIGGRGLSYIEDGKLKLFDQYNEFQELEKAIALFYYQDKNGVIWIGSEDGLYQLDLKKGIVEGYGLNRTEEYFLPTNKFQHMHQDAQGIYWLATEDSGLIRWDKLRGDIKQFGKEQGFLSNNIYSVYEDEFNHLWLSSFNGLIQFKKQEESIIIYTEENGISDNEFNRISHYQASDGRLYFGGQNGVTGFHPKDFLYDSLNSEDLELEIQHVSVFGSKEIRDTLQDGSKIDLIDLAPDARVIDLELKASNLFWADKTEFHYTLLQLDDNGNALHASKENVSKDNHIELFGMKPGSYNLDIKAINKDGKQLGESVSVPLKIAAPFYQTIKFWIAAVIALVICFWASIKFRTAHLRKKKVELEQLVVERTQRILKDRKTITSQAEQIAEMREQLNRKDQLWLEQFQSIIIERLEDPNLDLPSLIDDMDIGRSVFYEKVKALTNMTPNQYIQELRLDKAKVILEEGKVKTVKEVSYSVGMNHPNYFSKLFKDRFGIPPSSYFRN